ncbi:low-density lipoprotein receptor-related protein 1B-like isoform X2 [Macrosteles quadrilineatus]|uniref:low-density lipoprotein receptor-related protein 1B-like isoform X2 n=1 Tax=Macrosteles quadrilineatus TaxID=74068 RepID=UPI0023E15A39|nr:low-density lipoprotein receptor-related protein 1B-like isoform X2 [Macrosteles quadrilineatus]
MGSRYSDCVVIIWVATFVLTDLCWAKRVLDTEENLFFRRKRTTSSRDDGCVLPPPLENGKFYPSARRCSPEDLAPACQMIPGTPVPENWVIFFYCDSGFTLNTTKPVSVCVKGRWTPPLPVCEVGAAECSSHDNCPGDKTCIVGKCSDSCDGLCGPNTECEVTSHRPLCNCKKNYVGNPFKGCILGDPVPVTLLLTQSSQVSLLDLERQKIVSVLHYTQGNSKGNSPSVTYHYRKKYIYYTGTNQIYRDEVAGRLTRTGPIVAVVSSGVDANVKLAVDWVHDKLYWMSHTAEVIEVSDLDGGNRTTLVSSGLTFNWNLDNIAVDPYAGLLFYVSNDSIFRMNLDGSNNTQINLTNDGKRGVYVLTLDTHKRRIFYTSWDLEEVTPYVESCDYEGKDGKDVPIGDRFSEIHAIAVFKDTVFFGHFKRGQYDEVWSVDLSNPVPTPVLVQSVDKGFLGLNVYHPDVQTEHM